MCYVCNALEIPCASCLISRLLTLSHLFPGNGYNVPHLSVLGVRQSKTSQLQPLSFLSLSPPGPLSLWNLSGKKDWLDQVTLYPRPVSQKKPFFYDFCWDVLVPNTGLILILCAPCLWKRHLKEKVAFLV